MKQALNYKILFIQQIRRIILSTKNKIRFTFSPPFEQEKAFAEKDDPVNKKRTDRLRLQRIWSYIFAEKKTQELQKIKAEK